MPAKGQHMSDEQRRKISEANRRRELPTEKRCPSCGSTKPAAEFRLRRPGGLVLASYCRPCEQLKARQETRVRKVVRKPRPTAMERFMAQVIKGEAGCWLFTGGRKANGYASFKLRSYVSVHAHRWSYEQHVGPIPEGLQIDHLCRVRNCVNPEHLEPVTPRENFRRSRRWPDREARERRLLDWLRDNPQSTAAAVAEQLGQPVATVRPVLVRLEVEGRVLIEHPHPRRCLYSATSDLTHLAPPERYATTPKETA